MAVAGTWRSLRSVMFVTLHVAVVASLIRYFNAASQRPASLVVWLVVAVGVASLISWPITRAILAGFDPDRRDPDRACPVCRRQELRPLVRPGAGIFQPVAGYRCASCSTTIRTVGGSKVIEPPSEPERAVNTSGIRFLDEPATVAEVWFLDDPPQSSD